MAWRIPARGALTALISLALLLCLSPATARPSPLANRVELTLGQVSHGVFAGLQYCAMQQACREGDGRGASRSALVGAGVAAGLSLWLSADGVPDGTAQLINGGSLLGGVAGLVYATRGEEASPDEAMSTMLWGQMLGLAAGAVYASRVKVTSGQAALIQAFSWWSGAVAWWWTALDEQTQDEETIANRALLAGAVGLGVGAYVARTSQISRQQVWGIHLGGVAGGVLAGLSANAMGVEEDRQIAQAVVAGSVAGIAWAGWYFSRQGASVRQAGQAEPTAMVMPTVEARRGGGIVGLAMTL